MANQSNKNVRASSADIDQATLSAASSDELFRVFVDAVTDYAIYVMDADGRIATWNTGAERLTGYRAEEALGAPFSLLYTDEDRASGHAEAVRRGAERAGRYEEDGWRVRKDGTRFWAHVAMTAVRDEQGQLIGFAKVMHDLTQQHATAEERERLLQRERQARADAERRAGEERALSQAIAAVGTSRSSGDALKQIAQRAVEATGANGAFAARIFSDRGDVEVVARAGDVPPQFAMYPYEQSYTRQAIEARSPLIVPRLSAFHAGIWGRDLPPQYRDWSMLAVPLIGANEPIGALFLLRDGTRPPFTAGESARAQNFGELASLVFRRLQLLEEAERRRDEVERISESRSRLMRGFSHDLKNPLGAADGYAALLEEGIPGKLDPEQCESVRRIRRSIRASLRLIDDLLELARAEAGEITLNRSLIDVAALAREVGEDFRAQLEAAGLALELQASTPLTVESDPARVRQIISNLMSNAVKYTREGSVTVAVAVLSDSSPARRGDWVTVSVADTGIGIPEDKREAIFQEFTRLDPGARQGAGVGLAISRRIARLLDGDIAVEPRTPQGSTFTLWLPVSAQGNP